MLLENLVHLSQEARCAAILEHGQTEMAAILEGLGRECALLSETINVERLGWAIAFNVEGPRESKIEKHVSKRGAIQSYRDRWSDGTRWLLIWSLLTKPVTRSSCGAACLMGELALSVACEHRDDWQNPAARPINLQNAGRAFKFVYGRAKSKVVGDVFRSFGERAGAPEAIADEAWSMVFCDYWSIRARSRFLGLSQISTLVCQVARYLALKALRPTNDISIDDPESDDRPLTRREIEVLISLGVRWDATEGLIEQELLRLIKKCMSRLPVRQRIVAQMVWLQDIRAKEVSETLRISEAAVSQHLKKAREAVCSCLRGDGYRVSG